MDPLRPIEQNRVTVAQICRSLAVSRLQAERGSRRGYDAVDAVGCDDSGKDARRMIAGCSNDAPLCETPRMQNPRRAFLAAFLLALASTIVAQPAPPATEK